MGYEEITLRDILVRDQEKLRKAGATGLANTTINGEMPKDAAQVFIELAESQNDFLTKVSNYHPSEPEQPIDIFSIVDDILQNVPDGVEPTEFVQGGNTGIILECKPTKAFMTILYEVAESTKGAQAIQAYQAKMAAKFGLNIIKVGFKGEAYVANTNGVNIANVNKGWITRAKESTATHKVDTSDYLTSSVIQYPALMDAMLEEIPDQYDGPALTFIMNRRSYRKLLDQLIAKTKTADLVISGAVVTYKGYPIEQAQYMTTGEVLLTPLKNLCYGLQNQIQRNVDDKKTANMYVYQWKARIGFQIGIADALVIAYDIPEPPSGG